MDENFSHEIRGGLEPGETRRLSLAPAMFGPWGAEELRNRKDLVLTVAVLDFEDASGARVRATKDSDLDSKRKRLKGLQSKRSALVVKAATGRD